MGQCPYWADTSQRDIISDIVLANAWLQPNVKFKLRTFAVVKTGGGQVARGRLEAGARSHCSLHEADKNESWSQEGVLFSMKGIRRCLNANQGKPGDKEARDTKVPVLVAYGPGSAKSPGM